MKSRVWRIMIAVLSLFFILNSGLVEEKAYVHASSISKRNTDQTSVDENRLPATVDEYVAGTKKSLYYIQDWSDFIKVQEFCKDSRVNGFEGIKFEILRPPLKSSGSSYTSDDTEKGVWNTEEMKATIAGEEYSFSGIGTSQSPFKGEMYCSFSGVTFKLDKPLFAYIGNGANIHDLKIEANHCSSAIADNIADGTFTIQGISVTGTIGYGNATEIAGTLAGTIWPGAVINVSDFTSTANVSAKTAGGLAGQMVSSASYPVTLHLANDVSIASGSQNKLTVEGSYAAGGIFGALTGEYTLDLNWLDLIQTRVGTSNVGGFSGQLVGYVVQYGEGTTTLTLSGKDTVNADVLAPGLAGGLVGYCDNATVTLPADIERFTMTGTVMVSNDGIAGGLIGECKNGAKLDASGVPITVNMKVYSSQGTTGGVIGVAEDTGMELNDITIDTGALLTGKVVGGMVAKLKGDGSRLLITTPTVNATLTDGGNSGNLGGILGKVYPGCAVELQGMVTVADKFSADEVIGAIVALQDSALIYHHSVEGMEGGVSQFDIPYDGGLPKYNDVYSYGGVFRNQDMGNGTLLIGDGTLENVGVVNNSITDGQLGQGGTADAAADLETFAIVTFSNGKFGLNAFTDASSVADVLADQYTLHSNVDISYDKTGIVTLNRNGEAATQDVTNRQYAFSGSLTGVNESITITQNFNLEQSCVGVFATLAGNAVFENLIIEGNVTRAEHVGGLAYRTYGTSLSLTNVQMKKTFENVTGSIGGVLVVKEGTDSFTVNAEDVTLASHINAGEVEETSGFITTMINGDVTVNMNRIVLGGGIEGNAENQGGFLGYAWEQTGGKINDVTVQFGTTYAAEGIFGGLIHTATNQKDSDASRLTLKNVNLANLSVTANGKSKCGLLLSNGKILALEVIDYSAQGVTVTGAASDFDELVGITDIRGSHTFGLLSIHNSSQWFSGGTGYHYENQATYNGSEPVGNKNTRYYYDVFQHLEDENGNPDPDAVLSQEGDYYVIDSGLRYFVVDLLQNCDKSSDYSQLTNLFKPYFPGELPSNNADYYARGDINLTNYSVYPIPRQWEFTLAGQNDAKITFAAAGMEDWTLPNIDTYNGANKYQHYQLHCSILGSTQERKVVIKDITLAGSIGYLMPYNCGALVAGTLNANAEISNITLDGLYISSYGEERGGGERNEGKNGSSLLIGHIAGTETKGEVQTVTFDNIVMKPDSYTLDNYAGIKYVAGSLICAAGGSDITGLAIKFTNMIIEDEIGAGDYDVSQKYGEYLKYASFIYNYEYTDNASINEGSGLYLFTEADEAAGRITYGAELDYDTEYYDTTNKVLKDGAAEPSTVWIPYVYRKKQIEVNPKSGDILKGCGTYEDPYIIETNKQFLTLYRYVNEVELDANTTEYQYETFYQGWKVIATGDDSTFCTTRHNVTVSGDGLTMTGNGVNDVKVYGKDDDFPTPDQMSQAYYQLAENIDLAELEKGTYAQIAQDFVGFGTLERPFVGVWDGDGHTIVLADKKKDRFYTTFGFIQYAKGCVVKDLTITTSHKSIVDGGGTIDMETVVNVADEEKTHNNINCSGGGVIACILGGDNIIDNVTTSVYMQTTLDASIGGYVGRVQKGGLILRNISEVNFADYRLYVNEKEGPYYGVIAGKVEDGYIVYEGAGDSYTYEPKVAACYVGGAPKEIEAVHNYTILCDAKLSAAGITVTKVQAATDAVNITVTVPNEAALQVMSMAMNADALNISWHNYRSQKEEYNQHWGYSESSRSRKADYSDIGCVSATADYLTAVKYDNVSGYNDGNYNSDRAYAYPYLYKYMGITQEQYLDYIVYHLNGNYSILNPAEPLNGTTYHITWELAEAEMYDMGLFKNGFRGIGSLYRTVDGYGATFRGDFDGNGSQIKLAIDRRVHWAEKTLFETTTHCGLFNSLYAPRCDKDVAVIYNGTAEFGKEAGEDTLPCFTIRDFAIGGSIKTYGDASAAASTGGVAGSILDGNYTFEEISVIAEAPLKIGDDDKEKNIYIDSFGGIVGTIQDDDSYVLIKNCHWKANDTIILRGNDNGGGFVGRFKGVILKIQDSTIENIEIDADTQMGGEAGGMVGKASSEENGKLLLLGTTENAVGIKNAYSEGYVVAGGLIGVAELEVTIENAYSQEVCVSAYNSMGGMIGQLAESKESTIRNVNVSDITTDENWAWDGDDTGTGGVVGLNGHTLTVENAHISGTVTDDVYSCYLQAIEKPRSGHNGVGGIVGYQKKELKLYLTDCEVSQVKLETDYSINNGAEFPKIMAGGLVGYAGSNVYLDGSIVTRGCYIKTPFQWDYEKTEVPRIGAGGLFGGIESIKISGVDSTMYTGLISENNRVEGKNAGGICGYATEARMRLHGSKIDGCVIEGDVTAGGFVGYLTTGDGVAFGEEKAYLSEAEEDKSEISNTNISARLAGGLVGHADIQQNRIRVENVELSGCEIRGIYWGDTQKERVAGGLFGKISFKANLTSDKGQIVVYKAVLEQNRILCENIGNAIKPAEIGYPAVGGLIGCSDRGNPGNFFCDLLELKPNNEIGMTIVTTDQQTGEKTWSPAKLVRYNAETDKYELTDLILPENFADDTSYTRSEVLNHLALEYGYCVGNMVGAAKQPEVDFYIWNSQEKAGVFETPVLVGNTPVDKPGNTPVTDVGYRAAIEIDESSQNYYRRQAHIVYGAPAAETAVVETIDGQEQEVIYRSYDADSNLAYMKKQVENAKKEYSFSDVENGRAAFFRTYRLTKEDIDLFEDAYVESYGFTDTPHEIDMPLLVLRAEHGTVQESMERVANIMTNMAGNSPLFADDDDASEIALSIETRRMAVKDGAVTEVADKVPSIVAEVEGNKTTYTATDAYKFDCITDEGITFTEVTFTYSMPDDPYHKKVFKLNVFVEEPVLYGVHMKIVEGSVSSVAEVKKSEMLANTAIQIASDSDYTLLMEYAYGDARTKMPDNIYTEKYFYLTENDNPKEIPVGTKLRLIDVSHGNVPYYYEVTQSGVTKVKFSDFVDAAGNAYVNQPVNTLPTTTDDGQGYYSDLAAPHQETPEALALHQLENVGVEQYLLTVLNETGGKQLYKIHTGMEAKMVGGTDVQNEGVQSQFSPINDAHEEMPYFSVTAVPGLVIQLEEGNEDNIKTQVSGKISKEDTLHVKMTFSLSAEDQAYWQLMSDGSGMDSENVGKYLELAFYFRDGTKRINLPDGTNFSYLLPNGSYSDNKVIQNNTLVYYYKDIRELFEQENSQYKIENLNGNTEVTLEFVLNFAGADLSEFSDGSYDAYIELLRTGNRDYPMGVGNTMDIYSTSVEAHVASSLGFAIKSIKLEQLAINTYPVAAPQDEIDYRIMFDFSDILERISGAGEEAALEKWAGFDYEVTYQLWKKTENGENVTYEPYTGGDGADGDDNIVIRIPWVDPDTGNEVLLESVGGKVTVKYQFDKSEISTGTEVDGESLPGLVSRDGEMLLTTADLVGVSQDNLTNYKIIATMKIRERGAELTGDEITTQDFFVFTVTKLKTDLSE